MINSRDIKDLHPTLQRGLNELIRRCKELNLPILITQTYRDNEYQNFLFNKKPKVTNARGGQSMHNHRLAFDFCKNIKGQEFSDSNFFRQVGKIWVEMGGEWGGNWTGFVDMPHCQFTNGRIDSDIFNKKYVMANDVKMRWEGEREIPSTSVTGNLASANPDVGKPTTANKGDYMIRDLKVLLNGQEKIVSAILDKDTNYIKLRDLEKLGLKVSWDENKKMPVIEK